MCRKGNQSVCAETVALVRQQLQVQGVPNRVLKAWNQANGGCVARQLREHKRINRPVEEEVRLTSAA